MSERSVWKGLVAGAIGGVAATLAKTVGEKFYPPRTEGQPEPPEVLAEKIAGHPLSSDSREISSEAIHWGFGITAGAIYGVIAEFYPAATAKEGATFGLTLMALTHETALPAMGLSEPAEDQSAREHTSEAATHLLFGVVTEKVRSLVRGQL